ncbi:MAG TPA: MarR family transcriptional regulator [Xanthobacteraceae bacterium]|jgi:DNA-binding MarR family transcriptional regulator
MDKRKQQLEVPKDGNAEELAGIFEQMMLQLTLLGHTLPTSATSLTPQQLKILFTLDFLGEPTPMSKLSAQLGVTAGTLTKVAGGLVEKKYLGRKRSEEDDRIVKLSLTKDGRAMVEHIKKYRRRFFGEICSGLSATERRRLIESHRHIFETYRGIVQQKRGSGT